MSKDKPLLWTIEEDSQVWLDTPITQEPTKIGPPLPEQAATTSGERYLVALALFSCIFLIGGWMWLKLPSDNNSPEGKVTILAHEEYQAHEPERLQWLAPHVAEAANRVLPTHLASELADLHTFIQATDTSEEIAVHTYLINFQDQMALVEVVTTTKVEGQSHRQTRVYRRTDTGWQRIESAGDIWGASQTLETAQLSIQYRPIDAAAVAEAAPKLAQFYDDLRRDFGLPVTMTVPAITIELVTEGALGEYLSSSATHAIRVPSPAILSVPVEMSSATLFYQSAVLPLTETVLAEVSEYQAGRSQWSLATWRPIMSALRLWVLWQDAGVLVAERDEIVSWLYQNAQAGQSGQVEARQPLPPGYKSLCYTYRTWKASLDMLKRLQDCKALLSPWHWREPLMPTQLAELYYDGRSVSQTYGGQYVPDRDLISTVALETVIEYVVASYGRDYLPRLIEAMGEYTSWQGLIPALFGISVEEFEAGWQAYLASH